MGTPIGNLEDVTLRALRVLTSVDLVAAEDTRHTRRLLSRYGIDTRTVSYHAHSGPGRRAEILDALAAGPVALVSDAGTPGVSDPGAELVDAAWAAGYTVVTVPGPSSVAGALSISGFAADRYTFLGFLPKRRSERVAALSAALPRSETIVAFESPHRLGATLQDLAAIEPDRRLAVARELTKIHEELWRGTAAEAAAHWGEREVRGEVTLVVAPGAPAQRTPWSDAQVRSELERLRDEGLGPKAASKSLAERAARPAREIYDLWPHGARDDEVGAT